MFTGKVQKILDQLNELNAEQIATKLQSEGINGKMHSPTRCPIANYLAANTIFNKVSVNVHSVMVTPLGFTLLKKVPVPPNVRDFICEFDSGQYPHLIGNWKK